MLLTAQLSLNPSINIFIGTFLTHQDVAVWEAKPTPLTFLLPAEMMTAVLLAGHSELYLLVQTWILNH